MASDFPASSSQQPFANPQPAPVSAASQATSPPTKQSLKSWWKGFRPPTKSQDTPGKYTFSKKASQAQKYFVSGTFVSRLPKNRGPLFHESLMNGSVTIIDGLPLVEDVSHASPILQTSTPSPRRASFHDFRHRYDSVRRSSSFLRGSPQSCRLQRQPLQRHTSEARPASARRAMRRSPIPHSPLTPIPKEVIFGQDHTSTADKFSVSTSLEPGIHSNSKNNPLSHFFNVLSFRLHSSPEEEKAKRNLKVAEPPTGIFGVPLRQSITYANVAISLVDAEGKSYIYGYVPIVVAKCGVYLKEKATNVEGIFRLSGSEKRIKELKTIFDSPDRYGKGLDWAGYTVHDAANVLRRYLNQLPEPIVPLELYDRFREPLRGHTKQAVGDTEGPQLEDNFDVGRAISTYQQLITELPPLNRQLLLYILDLLAVFASKSDENRMNSQNLAAIFQPGMLSHPSHDMAPIEYRLSQDVLIFLIENQDHFLIGMRGTAADEQTVQEVQNGGTPPPGTPNTPNRSMNAIGRSASNASAGADSVRKFGGVRRNVSVSSRHSRQSNGAPSPASPAYSVSLSQTQSGGVHRSNTVPSKKSPGLPQNRLQKGSGSPSPASAGIFPSQHARSLSPSTPAGTTQNDSPLSAGPATVMGASGLAPSAITTSVVTSQERLLGDQKSEAPTPIKERNLTNLFQRSPTAESEKKPANKLRKKRIPSSSNPSAQSSTNSLHGQQSASASPAFGPTYEKKDLIEHPQLESIPSANPELSNTDATPPATEAPRAEHPPTRPDHLHHPSENTLKPATSPVSSLHSRSSYNDQSDLDHHDETAAAAEQREKRSRWRLSRRRDDSQSLGNALSPRKGFGGESNAGASTSSVGSSSRPRKSFTGDTVPVSSDTTLLGTHMQLSNDSGPTSEEKKGPLGWIKSKMREKREEKEAEKERTKSPPASADRIAKPFTARGKSVDIKREDVSVPIAEKEPPLPQPQQPQ